jgi:hypothetical protein
MQIAYYSRQPCNWTTIHSYVHKKRVEQDLDYPLLDYVRNFSLVDLLRKY